MRLEDIGKAYELKEDYYRLKQIRDKMDDEEFRIWGVMFGGVDLCPMPESFKAKIKALVDAEIADILRQIEEI